MGWDFQGHISHLVPAETPQSWAPTPACNHQAAALQNVEQGFQPLLARIPELTSPLTLIISRFSFSSREWGWMKFSSGLLNPILRAHMRLSP